MMTWSSIESLKHNLSKIALDVHHDDDDLEIYDNDLSSVSDRRNSHGFAHSKSVSRSPVPNGINDSSSSSSSSSTPYNFEIEHYKSEIRRLQESEAEIKALSVNYAAILKEKEDQISRLNQENGSLKQNLDVTKEALNVSRNDNARASTNNANVLKGGSDQSPKRQLKSTTQVKNRYVGNQIQNGVGNGVAHGIQYDGLQSKEDPGSSNSSVKEKELADLLEEKNRSMAALQATHERQIKQFRVELEKQHDQLANLQLKLQEQQKLNESFQEELRMQKTDKNNTSIEMSKLHKELDEKISEIKRLEMELSRSKQEDVDEIVKNLKRAIANLEKENTSLKMAKNKLEAAVEMSRNSLTDKTSPDGKADSSVNISKKEEMELLLQKMERELMETRREREKALQQLTRLKQHLLEKECEESEKMEQDSKIIEELRENNEYQKAQIIHLEKALKQAIASQEEVRTTNNSEIQKSKEMIENLNKKLANCMRVIDSQSVELQNLQTALGQYFAEIEAKEHLERQFALAREESAKLSERLKDAERGTEASNREKEEILAKLSHTERTLAEGKNRVNKLEEDNAKLRRALEQSMTRLNRMSMDSDYLVDRRIVIKLLVTYFQRNHSKEVLDLMVRMLGFSDDDKQRIGMAQQGGRGVVRGVLGLPGRLVGGILGGSSVDVHGKAASEDQSFADLWVDFLLKETEEREKRESMEDASKPKEDSGGRSPDAVGPIPNHVSSSTVDSISGVSRSNFSAHNYSPLSFQENLQPFEHSDSEFSTVPLTSLDSNSRLSRLFQKQ